MQAVEDSTIRNTIRDWHALHGEIFCPHTATAVHVLERLRGRAETGAWAVVATAHAAKFDSVVEPLIGAPVPVPAALAELLTRPSSAEPQRADYAALRERLAVP